MKSALWDFTLFTERRWWQAIALALWAVLIVASFTGCWFNRLNDSIMAPTKVVSGTITTVRRDESYEAICGIKAHIYKQCDDVPICCAYQIGITNEAGHTDWVFAFWPRYALGLERGRHILATLHRDQVIQFGRCNAYMCPSDVAYVIERDEDWRYTDP